MKLSFSHIQRINSKDEMRFGETSKMGYFLKIKIY